MGVYKYKQSIIVRGDLDMPKGKMAAQVAHAGEKPGHLYRMTVPAPVYEWLSGDFAKIVLKCRTLDDLLALEERAKAQGIPCKLIKDNGTTVFNEPTITCIAVGPWDAEVIDSMTKEFKLL